MTTSFEDLDAHIAAARRLVDSLEVNARDLRDLGGHDDDKAAMAADIARKNVAVAVAVLIRLLDAIDASLLVKEVERHERDPVDSTKPPVQPDSDPRRAADRVRGYVNDFLKKEPAIAAEAKQQIEDSR